MSSIKKNLNFSKKIKQARRELAYSQKKMGRLLKLSDRTISAYEVGRALPSLEMLLKIAAVTHRPVSYFFEEKPIEDFKLKDKIQTIEKELALIKKILNKKKTK